MITDKGEVHIKNYLAHEVSVLANAVAVGLSDTAAAGTDTHLGFEVIRAYTTSSSYDFDNNRIVFKATLPSDYVGQVREVGLWYSPLNTNQDDFVSKPITSFNQATDVWTAGTWDSTNTRIGADSLRLAPAVSATVTATQNDIKMDLSGYSSADKFLVAYHVGNGNTASVVVRFKTDSSNYYQYTISTPTAGYKVSSLTKGAAVVTGSPTWENITTLEVATTSTAGGSSTVDFDGIRVEDTDTVNDGHILVARKVLSVPENKIHARTQDVEFSLAVNIT